MTHPTDDTPTTEAIAFCVRHPENDRPLLEIASNEGSPVLRLLDDKGRVWFELGPLHPTGPTRDHPEIKVYHPPTGQLAVALSVTSDGDGNVAIMAPGEKLAAAMYATDEGGSVVVYDPTYTPERGIASLSARERGLLVFHPEIACPCISLTVQAVK